MDKPSLIPFPDTAREKRERTFDIARRAIPLLQAALDAGNATLLGELFAVLGDVAGGADALARADEIWIGDAEIVQLVRGRS